ncbi:MAG: YetF domain-containing protein [Jatrophihabitantaceae bacterium]
MGELAAQARQNNIADLGSVRYAVLETSGTISFLTDHPA